LSEKLAVDCEGRGGDHETRGGDHEMRGGDHKSIGTDRFRRIFQKEIPHIDPLGHRCAEENFVRPTGGIVLVLAKIQLFTGERSIDRSKIFPVASK
jgi:hypothetical protein